MKDIQYYREKYLNRQAQVVVIGPDQELRNSCNTLFDFSPLVGKPAFEEFDFLKGMGPTLLALLPGKKPFLMPAMEFTFGGRTLICDFEFHREQTQEGKFLIWTLHDLTREYSRLRELHQRKNESLIESEIVRQQHQIMESYIEKLEKANHELDRFAYVVSHDLKTPLRGIRNLTGWIEEDMGDDLPEEVAEHMHLLRRQVKTMEALIESVLKYSRAGREKLQKEQVLVRDLVQEIVSLIPVPAGIRVEIDPNLPVLITYRVMLQQVLTNLISNAIKHHDKTEGGWVRITGTNHDEYMEIVVEDNGPGIESDFHEKIFEIFQTLGKPNPESTGIGLAIVRKVVKEVGGSVRVESEQGKGARFIINWPWD